MEPIWIPLPDWMKQSVFSWLLSTDWMNEEEKGEHRVQGHQKFALTGVQ